MESALQDVGAANVGVLRGLRAAQEPQWRRRISTTCRCHFRRRKTEKTWGVLQTWKNTRKHCVFFCNLVWKQKNLGENLHFLFKQRKKVRKVLETTERLTAIFLCWTNRPFFLFSKRTFSISLVVEASFFLICKPTFFFASLFFAFQVTSRVAVCWISFLRDSFLVSLSRARQLTTAEPKIPWTVASETTSSLSTNQKVSLKISWKFVEHFEMFTWKSVHHSSRLSMCKFFSQATLHSVVRQCDCCTKIGPSQAIRQRRKGGQMGMVRNRTKRTKRTKMNEVIWVLSKWTWLTWRFVQLSVRAPIQKIRAQLLSCSAHCPRSLKSYGDMTPSLRLVWSSEVRLCSFMFVYQNVVWNAANSTYKKNQASSIGIDFQFRCIHINMSLGSLQSSAERVFSPAKPDQSLLSIKMFKKT